MPWRNTGNVVYDSTYCAIIERCFAILLERITMTLHSKMSFNCICIITMVLYTVATACEDQNSSSSLSDSDGEGYDVEELTETNPLCLNIGTDGATSRCLEPRWPPEYYVEQSMKYFDTLDIDADPESIPEYSQLVARWEWPPWLLLTGYGKETMLSTASVLRQFDPSTVPERDCRAFDVQPFGRCYIVFEYDGRSCPIYEEFTFNDQGEMTFIEAWSDLPDLRPTQEEDLWSIKGEIARLSTRLPGLGNEAGAIDLDSSWMIEAAESDEDVAEFQKRARDQWTYWWNELQASENLYERGCGW